MSVKQKCSPIPQSSRLKCICVIHALKSFHGSGDSDKSVAPALWILSWWSVWTPYQDTVVYSVSLYNKELYVLQFHIYEEDAIATISPHIREHILAYTQGWTFLFKDVFLCYM